ncbi:MAG: type VI secretion system tube protein TssD [Bacteroidales bacterium]|nr:type VI secretion system tube protein TssD [Bacteroidales bacterium]
MAKTPVKMEIEGYAEREVLSLDYTFSQATDIQGQMTGIPRGGFIHVVVKALNDGNPELMAWMVDPRLIKKGKISFNETTSGKKMKDIEFTDAYCVKYHERWEDNHEHIEEITITCREIKFGNIAYENDWA